MRCLVAGLAGSRFCEKPNVRCTATWGIRGGIWLLLWLVAVSANAQTLTTLLSFSGSNGQNPYADLTLIGNTLYGTTINGGANGYGAVFSVPVSGGTPTVLASFNGNNGKNPYGGLTLSGSTLYGTTANGGAANYGTVFSLPLSGGTPTALTSFNGNNGEYPDSGLTLSGNTLYGTTCYGGKLSDNGGLGDGTVFSLPVGGGSLTTLASFNAGNGQGAHSGLLLIGNALFGTTIDGGAHGPGAVFSISVSGGTPTALASFNGSNGQNPYGDLTLIGNTLYGTTYWGGAYNYGEVFSLPLGGGTPTVLASFNGGNATHPNAGLTLIGNTLYGTTESDNPHNCGTIFSLPLSGGTPTVLTTFNGSNGSWPDSDLTLIGNTLYGTTRYGGVGYNGPQTGDGTIFALNIAPATITLGNLSSATIIGGGTATLGMTVSNSPSSGYNLNYTLNATVLNGSATLGAITSGTGRLAPSASQACTVSATSTNLGVNTIALTASDPNSSNLSQTTTATLTVLDHAAAAFANGSGTLNLDFGTLQVGSGTQSLQFQIQNLPAAYRAALDLDSVMVLSDSDGVFSTDAVSFSDLRAGETSNEFDLFLNTSQMGNFSGEYQFNLSDEQDLSGHAGQQTLTLNVTADVVPEPSTLVLLGIATCLVGYGWRRRRVTGRTAKPTALDQQPDPSILSFPSHSSPASAARRAA